MPDPDILIRTGGHKRLSNFMLWQLAYAELFFLKKLWPDFNAKDLSLIIKNFKKHKKKFWSSMISQNFKKRFYTSVVLLIIFFLIFEFSYLLVLSLLILGVLSIIEFAGIIKKLFKNKYYIFLQISFLDYIYFFPIAFYFSFFQILYN